jgi:pyrimidine-nucleoside phosphorylase
MEQPLGLAVGNTLEVKEAVETLQGRGPADLVELALILGSQLLEMSGRAANIPEARRRLEEVLRSGAAFEKYKAFIAQQGGDIGYLEDLSRLPLAPHREEFKTDKAGYIQAIDAEIIGIAAYTLGAGRKVKTDTIDPAVGLVLRKKVGDKVEVGESLLEIHAQSQTQAAGIKESLLQAYGFSDSPVVAPRLIDTII